MKPASCCHSLQSRLVIVVMLLNSDILLAKMCLSLVKLNIMQECNFSQLQKSLHAPGCHVLEHPMTEIRFK